MRRELNDENVYLLIGLLVCVCCELNVRRVKLLLQYYYYYYYGYYIILCCFIADRQ